MKKKTCFLFKKSFPFLFLLLALSFSVTAYSMFRNVSPQSYPQDPSTSEDSAVFEDKLFISHDVLDIHISAAFKTLGRNPDDDTTYHPAVLWYNLPDKDSVVLNVKVQLRGKYRKELCDFPPFKIKFPKDQAKNTIFDGQVELKLVAHCNTSREKIFKRYVLQEYLVYRTYNLITELSYKVRLLKITYTNNGTKSDPFTRYGFLIEKTRNMARRNKGIEVEKKGIDKSVTDFEKSNIFFLFQYMIGNTDWSIPGLHNVKVLAFQDPSYVPVPFDFDFCGIVGTWYAIPDTTLPIASVKQRCWRGPGRTPEKLRPAIELFNEQKDAIYSMFSEFTLLDEKYIGKMLAYYDKFYQIINDPKKVKKQFGQYCSSVRK